MVKLSYCVSFSTAVMLEFVAGKLVLNFRQVETVSRATQAQADIESCSIDSVERIVLVENASDIICAKITHYCFYFVIGYMS